MYNRQSLVCAPPPPPNFCVHTRDLLCVHTRDFLCTHKGTQEISCLPTGNFLCAHNRLFVCTQEISCVHTGDLLCAHKRSLVCTQEISCVHTRGLSWAHKNSLVEKCMVPSWPELGTQHPTQPQITLGPQHPTGVGCWAPSVGCNIRQMPTSGAWRQVCQSRMIRTRIHPWDIVMRNAHVGMV